jgi:REP element-mobilizing transposase RayT
MHPEAPGLSTIVHWFKTRTVAVYGERVKEHGWPRYPGHLWQSGFTDRVLRSEKEVIQKRAYIEANPSRWKWDEGFPDAR